MIEEGWTGICRIRRTLSFHCLRDGLLSISPVNPACVPDSMKDDLSACLDGVNLVTPKNSGQWQYGINGLRDRYRDKPREGSYLVNRLLKRGALLMSTKQRHRQLLFTEIGRLSTLLTK